MPLNDRDRKALKFGGIVAAVLVLALLGLGQLGKGGAPALPPSPSGPPRRRAWLRPGVPTSVRARAARRRREDPSPSPIFSGRDPFSLPPQFQTVARPAAFHRSRSDRSRPTGPVPTGSTGGPGPTGSTGGGPGPTGSTNPPTNGSTTVIGGHTVVLIDTFTTNGVSHATVEVDGIVYNPAEGATFAGGNFELRDVAGNCATFLFGDESFTLCFTPSK